MLYRSIVIVSLLLIIFIGGASFSRADLLEELMAAKTILNVLKREEQSPPEARLLLESACPCIEWIIHAIEAEAANQLTYAQCVEFSTTALAGLLSTLCIRDEGGDALLTQSLGLSANNTTVTSHEGDLGSKAEEKAGNDTENNTLWLEDQSHRERALRLALQLVNELIEYAQGTRAPWGCVPTAARLCDCVQVTHTFHMPQSQFE